MTTVHSHTSRSHAGPTTANPGTGHRGPVDDEQTRSLSDIASENLAEIRDDVEDLIDRASAEATKLKQAAQDYGASFARERKLGAADAILRIAESLRDMGERLEDSPNLRALADEAAENLEDVSDGIRSRSFGDLLSDAETFARNRPLTVAAGAAICGLLVARFVKSSGDRRDDRGLDNRSDFPTSGNW